MHTPPTFQRAPRLFPDIPKGEVEIPAPPAAPTRSSGSLITILLPLLMAIVMLGVTVGIAGSNAALAVVSGGMMLVSSVVALITFFSQQRDYVRGMQNRSAKYRALLNQYRQDLVSKRDQQQMALGEVNPDPRECQARAERRDRRLWERAPQDSDFLCVRVGIGARPFSLTLKPPKQQNPLEPDPLVQEAQQLAEQFAEVTDVPICLSLRESGAAGLAGPRFALLKTARALALQIAAHHSPDEVKIVALFPADEMREWEWLRWLPHVWTDDHTRRLLASDRASAHQLLDGLDAMLRRRKQTTPGSSVSEAAPLSTFVFLMADPLLYEKEPIYQTLLSDNKSIGAFPIFLADRSDQLPRQCQCIVELEIGQPRLVQTTPVRQETPFTPDEVPVELADRFARALAPIRLQRAASSTEIPNTVPLCGLLGVNAVEDLNCLTRWQMSDSSRSLAVPLGKRAGSELLILDLHEHGHGPHGLVAGTSGSGKSELLQSLVASLAVHFHPHEVAFVLVDYKGGGTANAFRELPHLIGTITNLQGNLALRALTSLRAELQRRQRLFDQAGVNHIDAYQRSYRQKLVNEPLPHLIMIVDEFAELKSDQPDFMHELVSAVRVGRSLGVHLILATQKPAGVVDEQIWANSRFRICLRVERPEDSHEVLKRPDAANLTRPGRAFLQVGNNEIFELFQSAYGGTTYAPAGFVTYQDDIVEIALDGTRHPLRHSPQPTVIQSGITELQALVKHIAAIAAQNNIERLRGPWLPPLPNQITLDAIRPAEGWDRQTWQPVPSWLTPIIGLVDNPTTQSQNPLCLNLGKEGHLAIYGAPGTGKTTMLQTLIVSLALTHSPDEVNFYLLDFGGRLLTLFAPLPHVGGVILTDEAERLNRLLHFLLRELERRKALFAEAGVNTLSAYRQSSGNPLRAIVVILDNYSGFASAYPDAEEQIAQLVREGGNLGIHFVITGTNPNAIRTKVSSNISMAVALQLTDATDYTSVVGRTHGLIPAPVPGRGLVKGTPPLEFQTALPVAGDTEADRTNALKTLIEQMRQKWTGKTAQPIPILPDIVPLESILSPGETWMPSPADGSLSVLLGLDVDELEPIKVDLNDGPHFAITGPIQSGKTTFLQTWLLALAEVFAPSRLQLYLVDLHRVSWGAFGRLPHTRALIEDDDQLGQALADIAQTLQERRRVLDDVRRATGGIPDNSWLANHPAIVLAIDNLDALRDGVQSGTGDRLEQLIRRERGLGFYVLLAGASSDLTSAWDNWIKAIKDAQTGFLLGSSEHNDLALFNLRLPIGEAGKPVPPGQGFYARRGRFRKIKTATCFAGALSLTAWIEKIRQRAQK
jgi:S-DNA-T family DNA segregation ATPase FtsK/SpoIIIE